MIFQSYLYSLVAPSRPIRGCALALVAWLVVATTPLRAAELVPVAEVAADYVKPQQRIDLGDGRRINLYCRGSGSPTVVFDAGLSDWSSTWALIQPAVGKHTRACAYDRPGMGYSDPAPGRRTPRRAVEDLVRLLDRAGIEGRVVLVGHSLGGFHTKLFAALHPAKVAGLVLVDPAEDRLWQRVTPALEKRFDPALIRSAAREDEEGMAAAVAHLRECASWARAGELSDARYPTCTDPLRRPLGETILAERRRLQPMPAYQEAQAAEIAACMYVPDAEADASYARLFDRERALGDLPLIVLTHGFYDMSEDNSEVHYLSWRMAHAQTAALSSRGSQRMVPNSMHNLQIDSPAAVVDAILTVLQMARETHSPASGGGQTSPEAPH
jgi:pimeloyl-ACP methyl ester carboxylesterase